MLCPAWARVECLEAYASRGGPMGLPVVFVGAPAVRKSALIEDTAEALELPRYTFPVDSLELDDLNGLVINNGGTLQRLTDNTRVLSILDSGEGVLFVDEINTGRGIDAALNRLVYDRELLRKKLPPGIRVLAAMNPPHLSAGGRPLRPSLANRLCHIKVSPPELGAWCAYRSGAVDASETRERYEGARARLNTHWVESQERAEQGVRAFLHAQPHLLHKTPTVESGQLSGPWPSPRSWTLAINALATAYALGFSTAQAFEVVNGCVSEGVGSALYTYLEGKKIPSTEDVLAGRWTPVEEADVLFAVTSSLIHKIPYVLSSQHNATEEDYVKVGNLLTMVEACDSYRDVMRPLITALTHHHYGLNLALKHPVGSLPHRLGKRFSEIAKKYPSTVFGTELAPAPSAPYKVAEPYGGLLRSPLWVSVKRASC